MANSEHGAASRSADAGVSEKQISTRCICVTKHLPVAMQRPVWSLADFILHKELHQGKLTALYLATDRMTGTRVVLKLSRKSQMNTLTRHQAHREIYIHSRMDHTNIIKLYAAFEDSKYLYMVMEHAGDGDLYVKLKNSGGVMQEGPVVREVLLPLMDALAYMHSMGIIHRDVKPENILMSGNVLKLADFGLAIDCTRERPVTRAGTLDYLAPEVVMCPDKQHPGDNKDKDELVYSTKVDVWAVGILMFELLVGYPPYEYDTPVATLESILLDDVEFPSWMPVGTTDFINQALVKDPSCRPSINVLVAHPWAQLPCQPTQPSQEMESRHPRQESRRPLESRNSCPSEFHYTPMAPPAVAPAACQVRVLPTDLLMQVMAGPSQPEALPLPEVSSPTRPADPADRMFDKRQLMMMMMQQSAPDLMEGCAPGAMLLLLPTPPAVKAPAPGLKAPMHPSIAACRMLGDTPASPATPMTKSYFSE